MNPGLVLILAGVLLLLFTAAPAVLCWVLIILGIIWAVAPYPTRSRRGWYW